MPQHLKDKSWYWNAGSEDPLPFMLSGFDRALKFKILQTSEFSKKVRQCHGLTSVKQQLRTTQILIHSPPVCWGSELEK